jgi:hypothetical protein
MAVRVPSWAALRSLLVGLGLGSVPLAFHMLLAGRQLLANVFLDRVGADTRLPVPPQSLVLSLILLALIVASIALCVTAIRHRSRSELATSVLCLAILPQAIQRADIVHLLYVGVVVFPVSIAAVASSVRAGLGVSPSPRVAGALVLVPCAMMMLLGISAAIAVPRPAVVTIDGRTWYTENQASAKQLRGVVSAVRTAAAGRPFLVGTEDMSRFAITHAYLYYLVPDAVPRAYYLELAPGVTERRGSRLVADLSSVDVLVLGNFPRWKSRELYPYLHRGSQNANRYVSRHFCHVSNAGVLHIYERCRFP